MGMSVISRPPALIVCYGRQTYLDLDRPQVLRDLIRLCVVFRRIPSGLLLFFDAERGLGTGKMVALELPEEREDLVVGEQRRALIEDLLGGQMPRSACRKNCTDLHREPNAARAACSGV